MNEVMPRWRTFSSSASAQSPDGNDDGEAASVTAARPRATLPLLLSVLGGAAAGAALVMATLTLLASGPAGSPLGVDGTVLTAASGGLDTLTSLDVDGSVRVAEIDGGLESGPNDGAAGAEIVVDVAGAVKQPGLHRLYVGDRVGDAIVAAGGFGPRADLAAADRSLNLAQPLSDGVKVLVPELGAQGPHDEVTDDGRIDLNTADQAALESLPGIGPVTAGKIIEARSQQRFVSVADLLARGVVGQAVFQDIEDKVRTSG